jgi:succinyl-diaminopimelate desuccinylase
LPEATNIREAFAADLGRERDMIPAMAKALIACRCETPLGDTRAMADAVERLVGDVPEIEFERHAAATHIVNLIMRVRGGRPGRRLIFNGHMDTFPLVDATRWTVDPAGEERDGRLYGLGSSDMKSGLAAILPCGIWRGTAKHGRAKSSPPLPR